MIHLVYVSQATRQMYKADLEALLVQSRDRNAKCDITGMLLFVNGTFVQVLEGKEDDINAVYASIQRDSRNKNNFLIVKETIEKRAFPHWSMGFKQLRPEDYPYLEGFSDFIKYKMEPEELAKADIAVRLLYQFKEANL